MKTKNHGKTEHDFSGYVGRFLIMFIKRPEEGNGKRNKPFRRTTAFLIAAVLLLSLFAPYKASDVKAEEQDGGVEFSTTVTYILTFETSLKMIEVYYHILNAEGNEIWYGSVDTTNDSLEGFQTYTREIRLDDEPAQIYFSGKCMALTEFETYEVQYELENTEPMDFAECSSTTVMHYDSYLKTDYLWGWFSMSVKSVTNPKELDGDALDGAVVRIRPAGCASKAINIKHNGNDELRQNVLHLYDIGDSSRFQLWKADDDSYYIDFYDGSGHYDTHDKRVDIDDANGYDNRGNAVHVVLGNREAINKRWRFIQQSDGTFLIKNKYSGLYWNLEKSNSFDEGTKVVQNYFPAKWEIEVIYQRNDGGSNVRDMKRYDSYSYKTKSDGTVTGCNWMSHLPDALNIADLCIPGTHDAATAKVTTSLNHWGQAQQHTILEQLNSGLRYLDLRFAKDDDKVIFAHGSTTCYFDGNVLTFNTVKGWIEQFLAENPGETVIIQIKADRDGEDVQPMVFEALKNWGIVYRFSAGADGENPMLPELGELRGKVMVINRFNETKDVTQDTFRDANGKWWALDAHEWKTGSTEIVDFVAYKTTGRAVESKHFDIWTQDNYDLNSGTKKEWIEGSVFEEHYGAKARRDAALAEGKRALVISYTSCVKVINEAPQTAARNIHSWLLSKLENIDDTDPYVGIICNDFADAQLNELIYRRNFKRIHVFVRGMTFDGEEIASELQYHFSTNPDLKPVGELFAVRYNQEVLAHFTNDEYQPLCNGENSPKYLNQAPSTFKDDWSGMEDADVSLYDITNEDGIYVLYVPLIKEGEDTVKVTFDENGHGVTPNAVVLAKGSYLTDLPAMSDPNYVFYGWYYDNGQFDRFDPTVPIYEDITLRAEWGDTYQAKIEVVFPEGRVKPDSIGFKYSAHIYPQGDVPGEFTLDEEKNWTWRIPFSPSGCLDIQTADNYYWYLSTEYGDLPFTVTTEDGLRTIHLDPRHQRYYWNGDPNGWTSKQCDDAYWSLYYGNAVIKVIYNPYCSARMTWDDDEKTQITDANGVIHKFSWQEAMTQHWPLELVLEHRTQNADGKSVWEKVSTGKIVGHSNSTYPSYECVINSVCTDAWDNYRVRLNAKKVDGRYDFFILEPEYGAEKLIYDKADEDAIGEPNVYSYLLSEEYQPDLSDHRRTHRLSYKKDKYGNYTINSTRIGDFTAEVKWDSLPGKYADFKPVINAVQLRISGKNDGSVETKTVDDTGGWKTRFDTTWEYVDTAQDEYEIAFVAGGNTLEEGKVFRISMTDGDEVVLLRFTVHYDRSDPYHTVVYLEYVHTHILEHRAYQSASCTEDGCIEHWYCTECEGYFTDAEAEHEITEEQVIIKALGHKWSSWEMTVEPTDETEGEEQRTCLRCGETQTSAIPVGHLHKLKKVEPKAPDCTHPGNIEYWVCEKCGCFFEDDISGVEITEEEVMIAALGHDWGEPEYIWAEDNRTVTASRACKRDGCDGKETETVDTEIEVITAATCTEAGEGRYTATFENEAFEAQSKMAEISMLGHDWADPVFTWDGYESAAATRTCRNDAEHTETVDCVITNEVTREETAAEDGVRTYTATATFEDGTVVTDTKTEVIPAYGWKWTRVFGANRFKTMEAIIQEACSEETEGSFSTLIVATGESFPDALAGSALAGVYECPILLTKSSALSAEAKSEIERLRCAEGCNVIILGGTGAVSEKVEQAILAIDKDHITVERVKGGNRELSALEVYRKGLEAENGFRDVDTVIITTGYEFADALSISPYAYASKTPVLLTKKDGTLRDEVKAILENGGFKKAIIVGGTAAVSGESEDYLKGLGMEVIRLKGGNRYNTSAQIIRWEMGLLPEEEYFLPSVIMSNAGMGVARGDSFADALSSVSLLGRNGSVLMLVHSESYRSTIEENIEELIKPYVREMGRGYIFGGIGAVSQEIEDMLNEATAK